MKLMSFIRTWFFKKASKLVKFLLLGSITTLGFIVWFITHLVREHVKPIVWLPALCLIALLLYLLEGVLGYFKNTYFAGMKRCLTRLDKDDVKTLCGAAPECRFEKFYFTDKFLCVPDICFLTRYSDIESIDIALKQNYDDGAIGKLVAEGDVYGKISIKIKGEKDSHIVIVKEGRYIKGRFDSFTKLIEEKK
ncbi:hypothetical protein [Ruminococcus albus]|uniref:Uncharacterized protein n=1 Tax=Ruminococcus albus TaxID=1264 RepID=A0A1I1F9R4_RUMAL|nr:hypothetical protein [Ruminococcus albus]SFB96031.1 hypothetical protein SAMN02910406_00912 [Ruminococcus albus]